jgi:hypothetical protein
MEAIAAFQHWLAGSASHRAFFTAHATRHAMLKEASGGELSAFCLTPADELERIYEQLMDAHSVESALSKHCQICEILSRELDALAGLRRRPEPYVFSLAIIEERLRQHAALTHLLCSTGIVIE